MGSTVRSRIAVSPVTVSKDTQMKNRWILGSFLSLSLVLLTTAVTAQMIDNTQAPNTAKAGINKSLLDEIGPRSGRCNDTWIVDLHH